MSYKIGQFRKNQQGGYLNPLSISKNLIENTTGGSVFYDVCGNVTNMNGQNFYYLKFGIKQRLDSAQSFYLKIRNTENIENSEQLIEEYSIGAGNNMVYFETIISPNTSCNQILWELKRTSLDYSISDSNNITGRVAEIEIENYSSLIDIIPILKNSYPELNYLTKIGIQGPTGLLMCINGAPIRIGKSGIYEINNGMQITSLGFVPNQSDYFIVDFEY